MADTTETIRVMPWGKDQGAFVEINAEDFDAKVHKPYVDPLDHDGDGKKGGGKKAKASTDPLDFPHDDAGGLTKREMHADLEAKGIEFDPAATSAELFALLNPPE